ncbi:MAG: hypothetical protein IKE91_04410 [Clostridia bacterium]|nr:hypothetical protein [Clostridia bacterium]
MTTLEKAMQANLTAGGAERITVDGFEFSRLPLDEPVMWIPYKDIMQRERGLEDLTDIATEARAMIALSGHTWAEYQKLPLAGPTFESKTSIWGHFGASLELFSEAFLNQGDDFSGIWYYNYDADFVVIMPRGASHLMLAKYYVSKDEYDFLKSCGFKFKNLHSNHPNPRYAYFLNVEKYDADTKTGIITL